MPPALVLPAAVCGAVIVSCWLLSLATREYSWVDRIWSVVPPVYIGLFAWQSGDARLWGMTALTTAWGARLTFNFARKGGYAPGGEDYRWQEVRKRMGPAAWQVFNLAFIAGYQNVLLFLLTLPAWVAAGSDAPLGPVDFVAAALFIALLVGETVADEQQWRFQQAKRAAIARGEPHEPFLRTGLFAWSRHPNFFCEQAQWWALTLFPVAAGVGWVNIGLLGPVLLTLLFLGSARLTEALSLAKYPSYADYQRTTPCMLPRPPR